jgi:DMSO/TMAO reductase YedYZ molybdopterin-dependent catalytic subunit
MAVLARLAPPPHLVDWSILALVAFEVGSGVVSLTVGRPSGAWLFTLHALAGLTLVALLGWKFRRVRRRITDRDRWDSGTPVSVLLGTLALATLGTGIYWALSGPVRIAGWPLLFLHMVLGVLVAPVLLWHLRHRFRPPSTAGMDRRRTTLQYGALLGFGALSWKAQQVAGDALSLPGRDRRFTGSKAEGSDEGNAFPVTSWVADDPEPVDPDDWSLSVGGAVTAPLELDLDALPPAPATAPRGDGSPTDASVGATSERAVLDCTSGWYSEHDWQGVRVGDLLDRADPADDAAWVRFRSVTGYYWSLPIDEARDALLATRVDGTPLSHGHGFPCRLVAPGRRGFQWVKWVESVEVTHRRDLGQWVAIFVSGLH